MQCCDSAFQYQAQKHGEKEHVQYIKRRLQLDFDGRCNLPPTASHHGAEYSRAGVDLPEATRPESAYRGYQKNPCCGPGRRPRQRRSPHLLEHVLVELARFGGDRKNGSELGEVALLVIDTGGILVVVRVYMGRFLWKLSIN